MANKWFDISMIMKKFSLLLYGNGNPIMRRRRDGKIPPRGAKPWVGEFKIPYESRKAHLHSRASHNFFPTRGLAGVVEKKIHHKWRSHEWWIFFPPQLLSHKWGKNCDAHGNVDVPWVTNMGFFPSLLLLMMGLPFPYSKSENFFIIIEISNHLMAIWD